MQKSTINHEEGKITIEFWTKSKILKTERAKSELSLDIVSKKTGLSSSYLSQIENNKRSCPNTTFLKILTESFGFKPVIAGRILKETKRDLDKIKAIQTIFYL